MKRAVSVIIYILVIIFIMTGCTRSLRSKSQEDSSEKEYVSKDDVMDKGPVRGGILNLFSTFPDTLNPLLTKNKYVQSFSSLMFESLVKLDKNQRPIPMLADRWDVSSDGLIWNFHIREDVNWQDNLPLTAEDVEFTLQSILNGAYGSVYLKNLQNISSFMVKDKNNIQVSLKRPDSFTAESMTFPIIPKHRYEGEYLTTAKNNMLPVGTGPYRFVSYENNVIKLIINDNWWNMENSTRNTVATPYIGEIDIKLYQNTGNALNAFQNREIDYIALEGGQYSKYSSRSDVTVRKYPDRNYEFLAFNLSKTVFADKTVRQAISAAIDKTRIVNEVLAGEATTADIPLIPDTWLYNTNFNSAISNKDAAREMLYKSGWKDDRGSMYKYQNGSTYSLNFEILVNDDNENRFKVASNICDQLKEIGINAKVKKLPWDQFNKEINDKKFDIALMGCSISSIPEYSYLYSTGYMNLGGSGPRNVAGYSNSDLDSLILQTVTEYNYEKKKELYAGMNRIITDDLPYIGLYFNCNAVIYSKRIRGEINPYIWNEYNDITRWYLPAK